MKKLNYFLAFIFVLGLITMFSCGPDDTPVVDPVADQVVLLSKSWAVATGSSVTPPEGGDATTEFTNFQITFSSNKTYSVTGQSVDRDVFKGSGSWAFKDETGDLSQITFDGDPRTVSANVNAAGTLLSLTFTLSGGTALGNGRTMGTDGAWNFSNLSSN